MINIPRGYPDELPKVKESDGRIPSSFHTNPGGELCLSTVPEMKLRFSEDRSLFGFINGLLVEYLYSYSYYEKFGKLPYGQYDHGDEGIRQFYRKYFDESNDEAVMGLIKATLDHYRGDRLCACGGTRIAKDCHASSINRLRRILSRDDLLSHYGIFLFPLIEAGKSPDRERLSTVFLKKLKRQQKKK